MAVDPRVLFRAQSCGFEKPGRDGAIVRRVGRLEWGKCEESDVMTSPEVPVRYHAAGLGIVKPLR